MMPRKTRKRTASSSPYDSGERSMKVGREEKEDSTSDDKERMASGTERDRVGCEGNDRDAATSVYVRSAANDPRRHVIPHVRAAK